MATIRPFRAVRPKPERAADVAAPPYDVVSLAEARELAGDNASSFLRVSRAELELEDTVDPYSMVVYRRGSDNLQSLLQRGVLYQEPRPMLGVYRQRMGTHEQTGIVALASVEEYDRGLIKKHELTRPDKELDRVRLIETHESQSGPVFLTFRRDEAIARWLDAVTAEPPEVDFVAADGIGHTVWAVRGEERIAELVSYFALLEALYIADGHHRSAAASRVRAERRQSGRVAPGGADEGFLAVIFPHDQLQILSYNRVVRDLNGHEPEALLAKVGESFELAVTDAPGAPGRAGFDMYLAGAWHRATPRAGVVPEDPVGSLAVSVLADRVLAPLLGIRDQRTDKRIDFVGGIRGVRALEAAVDSGAGALAFWLYPTTVEELMSVADAGLIMPPKSTWFEPKLRDGLFVHMLE
jgi:uncharacterized protein (DUF1015 family)